MGFGGKMDGRIETTYVGQYEWILGFFHSFFTFATVTSTYTEIHVSAVCCSCIEGRWTHFNEIQAPRNEKGVGPTSSTLHPKQLTQKSTVSPWIPSNIATS